jgi:formate dehydrogenase subunit gamma
MIETILERHSKVEGNLLPILHDVQASFGHVSEAAMREIALALNLTRAEVHGVVSFYHDFRDAPDDRPVIKICAAEACQARGSDAVFAGAEAIGEGRVKIEKTYCLGLCSVGPAAIEGDRIFARLTAEKIRSLVSEL